MTTTLIAYPLNEANVEVPYVIDTTESVDISLTLTVQDITDVTKRQGSYSKTITLPSSSSNDACFGYAYNVQSFVGGFTPNKRIRAALWDNGVQVFNGSLQLLSIRRTSGQVEYEVGIYSEEVAFFRQVNETLLCQTAGVTGMNHAFTSGAVVNSWTATAGSGYVYGFVDGFGYSDAVPSAWNALTSALLVPYYTLTPSIYVKQMVDLIFQQAGYRYSSAFFDSPRFKNLVIPYAGGATIQADLSGQNSYVLASGDISFVNVVASGYAGIVPFTNIQTDPQGYWNASGTFENIGFYTSWDYRVALEMLNDTGAPCDVQVAFIDTITSGVIGNSIIDFYSAGQQKTIEMVGSFRLNPNQDVAVEVQFLSAAEKALQLVSGSASMICTENTAALSTVDMTTALPMDITQGDFLSDLQKMFNLYFYVAPENPKTIFIEPFNAFYTSDSVDWSQKVDNNAPMEIQMGDPEMRKTITFKYKDSGDALGKTYSDTFAQGYGARVYQSENYYAKDEQVVETKCATLIPANYNTGLVIGRTFDVNANGTPKPRPTGYRIAQYKYISQPQFWVLLLDLTPTFAAYDTIPYIGHIDDPYAPTFDLAFGMPMQLYYKTFASGTIVPYTNANLFNLYWKTYIEETTSKEAMQIELSVILDSVDIYALDFRKPIYWNGIRWRLIEIRDYTIGGERPCQVVLRRILNLSEPATGAIPIRNYYDVNNLTLGEMNPQIANPTEL